MSSAGMGARGRSSRYSCSKIETRDVGVGIFLARGFLVREGWRVVAGISWKSVGGGAGDGEKSCRNLRRGEGPGCFGVVSVLILVTGIEMISYRNDFIRAGTGDWKSLSKCSREYNSKRRFLR